MGRKTEEKDNLEYDSDSFEPYVRPIYRDMDNLRPSNYRLFISHLDIGDRESSRSASGRRTD